MNDEQEQRLRLAEQYESNVRLYSRLFPEVFSHASGSMMYSVTGKAYLDFFAGAGTLNYGHNPPVLKQALIDYLSNDCIVHSLDMYTPPHVNFLVDFNRLILQPRSLAYKIQFTGPTGANAVEAALKLARIYTQRKSIIYFKNAFHGLSLGALSSSDLIEKKARIQVDYPDYLRMPYDKPQHSAEQIERLRKSISSLNKEQLPAAMILETVQAEGGVNASSEAWLRGVAEIAKEFGILLIIDDIQTGCGRTGRFFSFESSGIYPDIVCLSKSLSGYGLPLSIVLFKNELDVWNPGEHTGTFRSNNLSLVAAQNALTFWKNEEFQRQLTEKTDLVDDYLEHLVGQFHKFGLQKKGRGLIRGLQWSSDKLPYLVARAAFKQGLIIETAGHKDEVLKLTPPLTTSNEQLIEGLKIIEQSVHEVLNGKGI